MKFDIRCTQIEDVLYQYFYKSLRPLIRLWIDEKGQKLDDWNVLVKKAAKAEAKAKMQASASRNINQQCQRDNQLIYTIVAKA